MTLVCPICHSSDDVDALDDGRYFCERCNAAFDKPDPPRLIEYPERRRRDTDE